MRWKSETLLAELGSGLASGPRFDGNFGRKTEAGGIDMGGHGGLAVSAHIVNVPGQGKLSIAPNANAPLLVVFGGIDVGGVHSGVYMWKYMKSIESRYHVFVALSNHVNGTLAYNALMSIVQANGLTPSDQILYLFSGGYRPGIHILTSGGPGLFSAIFLVDIWMGVTKQSGSWVPDFYKALADTNTSKLTYVHTVFGANNNAARDYISNKIGSQKAVLVTGHKGQDGMAIHMSTNTVAVGMLP